MKKIKLVLFSLLFLSSTLQAGNYTIYPMSDLDVSMLPVFCQVWHSGDGVATDAWVKKLQIPNIHHLCKGLNHVNHATITSSNRYHHAKSGLGEFTYIINHGIGQKHFPLKPFIFVNMAKLHSFLNENQKAIGRYKDAIAENPKFSRAYAGLIDLYIQLKDVDSAQQILNKGLSHTPNSKLLQKRKKKLKR